MSSEWTEFSLQVTGEATEVQIGEDQYHSAESMPKSQMQLLEVLVPFPRRHLGSAMNIFPSVYHVPRLSLYPVAGDAEEKWLLLFSPGLPRGRNLTLISHPWWSSTVKYRLLGLREPQKCLPSKAVGPAGVLGNAASPSVLLLLVM